MKDCAFQYATRYMIYENTGLITRGEAIQLWDKYVKQFKEDMKADKSPEMAIWIDMDDQMNYRDTLRYWQSTDFVLIDGKLYQEVDEQPH